jgi:hypothetical protein
MLYAVTWKLADQNGCRRALAQFMKTKDLPPAGVRMHGRWFGIGEHVGFVVVETANPALVQQWAMRWDGKLEFEITPVMTDEQVVAGVKRK